MSPGDDQIPGGDGLRGEWGSGPFSASRRTRRRPRPWYLRRATVAGFLVVAIVAVAVITDLPTQANHSQRVSDAEGFVTGAYGYLNICNTALAEAFSIASQVASRRLTSADLMRVPDLLRDDNLACSLTNDAVYQLASMAIPRALAGSNQFATALYEWVVPDAFGATREIAALASDPGNPTASALLRRFDAQLTSDRASAERALEAMDRQLDTSLTPLPLFKVPPGSPPLADRQGADS